MYRFLTVLAFIMMVTPLATVQPVEASVSYEMFFPIVGEVVYSDTWGAARSGGRSHTGTDIMADKMEPVVAVASGTVYWMHDGQGSNCCAMGLRHDDGWISYYIHLNNDTPGTDDGQGWGFAPGLTVGSHVEAGELIGYVGDSGNAEWTASHLHFELHRPDGTRVNPYNHLKVARVLTEPIGPGGVPPLGTDLSGLERTSSGYLSREWSLVERVELDGNPGNELLFYSSADGRIRFNQAGVEGGGVGEVVSERLIGKGWDSVEPVDLDGDGVDEILFYRRSNGRFAFYDLRPDGSLGTAVRVGYFGVGWTSVEPVDTDGDGEDELIFYRRSSGRFALYNLRANGGLGNAVRVGYFASGWSGITGVDGDGDGLEELVFYRRSNGRFAHYSLSPAGGLGTAIRAGYFASGWSSVTAGDGTGDGRDEFEVYRESYVAYDLFSFGES